MRVHSTNPSCGVDFDRKCNGGPLLSIIARSVGTRFEKDLFCDPFPQLAPCGWGLAPSVGGRVGCWTKFEADMWCVSVLPCG